MNARLDNTNSPRTASRKPRDKAKIRSSSAAVAADPVDAYLLELSAASPPLTSAEEQALARRIERAEDEAFALVIASGVRLPELVRIHREVCAGELTLRAVFRISDPRDGRAARDALAETAAAEERIAVIREALRARGTRGARHRNALRSELRQLVDRRKGLVEQIGLGRVHAQAIVARVERDIGELLRTDRALEKRAWARREDVDPDEARRTALRLERELGQTRASLRAVYPRLLRAQGRASSAREELTKANLRLVVSFAKRYAGRGVPIADLIQEGNIGLMRAVEKFDHRVGTKFSTYASWWLRQSMQRAVTAQGRTVRLPVHVAVSKATAARARRQLEHQLGRDPEPEEVAAAMGMSEEQARTALEAPPGSLSLDAPVGEDGRLSLGDVVADASAESPDEAAMRGDDCEQAEKVLSVLTAREERVLRLRYGIGGRRSHTLSEIGKQLNLTRERIRQIEAKAIEKIRRAVQTGRV